MVLRGCCHILRCLLCLVSQRIRSLWRRGLAKSVLTDDDREELMYSGKAARLRKHRCMMAWNEYTAELMEYNRTINRASQRLIVKPILSYLSDLYIL